MKQVLISIPKNITFNNTKTCKKLFEEHYGSSKFLNKLYIIFFFIAVDYIIMFLNISLESN